MISGPSPNNRTIQQQYSYDAWNRLVKVKDNFGAVVEVYGYDGLQTGNGVRNRCSVYSSHLLSRAPMNRCRKSVHSPGSPIRRR